MVDCNKQKEEDLLKENKQTSEDLQRKLYFLCEQLQKMVQALPQKYQQRIPNELLNGLAESLLDNTLIGIVNHLMDIQHVTEKQLFQQRLHFMNKQTLEVQEMLISEIDEASKAAQRLLLKERHKQELVEFDKKIILELDQKVYDQQRILEMAGVPGFEVTSDPAKIQVQIRLLDFILRLSQIEMPF
uniref:Gonadal protein gdl n=2 Tax=Clastoptera arizonana TaxID=38151 RepID=A0A1B6CFH0_9HEMI